MRREFDASAKTQDPGTGVITGSVQSITDPSAAITRTVLYSRLNKPTDFRFLPDGRVLISEKAGVIKVYNPTTDRLQWRRVIKLRTNKVAARGLLGIAVDPNYATNGFIYVSYVGADHHERLSRLTVKTNALTGVLTARSEKVLIKGSQTAADDHLGGDIQFGPDGKLYWAVGNNDQYFLTLPPPGSTYPGPDAQDLSSMYGKILRLNPDGTVPTDNPFAQTPNANPYVYAYGFRNPFRMTFDGNGQLLVGDVGENTWEEVDLVTAGGNYGWPLAEGPCSGIGTTSCSTPSPYVNPIYAYLHSSGGSSLTGVLPYTGSTFGPDYQNTIFIADYNQQWIMQLTCTADNSSCGNPVMFDAQAGRTVALRQGPDDNVYQLTLSGQLSRYAPSET
jgi:glucose/arabinose dehydrogenase